MAEDNVKFSCKPSPRRALFFAFVYAALVLAARYETQLNPVFNPIWHAALASILLGVAYAFLKGTRVAYSVTDSGVVARNGKRRDEIEFERIAEIDVRQSFLEQMLGVTNIYFKIAGSTVPGAAFSQISNTDAVRLKSFLRGDIPIIDRRRRPAGPREQLGPRSPVIMRRPVKPWNATTTSQYRNQPRR